MSKEKLLMRDNILSTNYLLLFTKYSSVLAQGYERGALSEYPTHHSVQMPYMLIYC